MHPRLLLRPVWPCHRATRPFSSATAAATAALPQPQHFDVPCRSNGSITLDLYHAVASAKSLSTSSSPPPLLIYLPPGPVLAHHTEEEEHHIIASLHASSAATIVRINYRASAAHPYPTPYHDVLFGYDFVCRHLLRDQYDRPTLGRLGVCGQLVGGSLATMLALTECRRGETRIAAAAVNNPIVDWLFPDDLHHNHAAVLPEPAVADESALPADQDAVSTSLPLVKPRRNKKASRTSWQAYGNNAVIPAVTLSAERDMMFRAPDHFLDRFASPIHFFRSPHAQMLVPEQDDIMTLQQPSECLDMEAQLALNHYASFHAKTWPPPSELPTLSKCRAYARNYPQTGTDLRLPVWHVATGLQSPLLDQSLELVKVLQRSIARQRLKSQSGRKRWLHDSEKEDYEQWAREQLPLQTHRGIGLWSPQDKNSDCTTHIEQVGAWMKQSLK